MHFSAVIFIKSAPTAERQRHKLEPSSEMTRESEVGHPEAPMGEEIKGKDNNKQSNEYEGLQRSASLTWQWHGSGMELA